MNKYRHWANNCQQIDVRVKRLRKSWLDAQGNHTWHVTGLLNKPSQMLIWLKRPWGYLSFLCVGIRPTRRLFHIPLKNLINFLKNNEFVFWICCLWQNKVPHILWDFTQFVSFYFFTTAKPCHQTTSLSQHSCSCIVNEHGFSRQLLQAKTNREECWI